MMKFAVMMAGVSMVSGAAVAQTQTLPVPVPVAPANIDKAKSDLDKVICRSQDEIGSRLERHQVCMTKQQWWTYEQENKNKVREMQIVGDAQSH